MFVFEREVVQRRAGLNPEKNKEAMKCVGGYEHEFERTLEAKRMAGESLLGNIRRHSQVNYHCIMAKVVIKPVDGDKVLDAQLL